MMKAPAALLLLAVLVSSVGAAERPNILWLTSEDHGPEMGCYGDELARTPNVDALAERGMIFTRAWSCFPVCAPARTAIITGMYPTSTGAEHMRSMAPMPAAARMFPAILREQGYYCTNNFKEDYNLKKANDVWDDSSKTAHWRNRSEGQPFFAVFNSQLSHEFRIYAEPHELVTDPAKVRVPAYHPDTPEVRRDWAQYYDKVSESDAKAGEALAELEKAGLADDTIVFYFGDHGSGMPRSKRWPGNSGLHVPMVVYFPEKWRSLAPKEYQPGGKSDRLVNFVDLAPTVLSIVGVEPPEWMQGRAFAGKYQQSPPEFTFGARGRMDECADTIRSVTDGRYVYLRNYMPHLPQSLHVDSQFRTPTTAVWRRLFDEGKTNEAQSIFWTAPRAPEELYDLLNDPDEVNNLAGSPEHREVLERLRAAHRQHVKRIRDVGFLPEGEIHARAGGGSPYDMARDPEKYPFDRIFETAELASSLDPGATSKLTTAADDADSAVRYWAVMGFLMRGEEGFAAGEDVLRKALDDESPYVQIAAAEAIVRHGSGADAEKALKVLETLAQPKQNGVLISRAALEALDQLGERAAPIVDAIATMDRTGPSPDQRFNVYPQRLAESIVARFRPVESEK